ncbi:MAG: transglycosylase SLT domain-containing protein [Acidobacteria bacterium]|nr:transglycosylase SLT domain-containing protein [Acidobacteriota bacterium]
MGLMYRVSLLIVFVFAALSGIFAFDPAETHNKIRQAVGARQYSAAAAELRALRTANARVFEANNYDYLLARMAESDGDIATAVANYQAVANRDSILKAYALFHLAKIFRQSGNLLLERLYLTKMSIESPNSLLISAARGRLAKSSFEASNFAETIRILSANTIGTPADRSSAAIARILREDDALLAEAYLRSGHTDPARSIFTRLLDETPDPSQPDDVALSAARSLDLIETGVENSGKKVADLTEAEHLRRANIYQFNRDFANAKLHYEAIIGRFSTGTNTPGCIYQIGRGYAQQTEYVEALKWYERLQEQYPDSPVVKDALLLAAAAYGRVGKSKEAIKRYQKFIEKYPADEKLDRAYLNIVDILRDQGDDIEALTRLAKTRELFKGKTADAVALFVESRIYISRNELPNALQALDRLAVLPDLGGSTVPGGTSHAEVAFLKGYVLELSKRYAEAIDVYLSIADGRNEYYGWRATERLKKLDNDEAARSFVSQKLGSLSNGLSAKDADERRRHAQTILRLTDAPELRQKALDVLKGAIKALPNYKIVQDIKPIVIGRKDVLSEARADQARTGLDELLFLGLYDEAVTQFDASLAAGSTEKNGSPVAAADLYRRGDRADKAIAFAEPLWKKIPADYPIELIPRDQLEMLYPAPYADPLLKYASPRGVDPRLLLAIMRQESRFQPNVKSYAAARGLMQFISTTSSKVAAELGRDNFKQDELYYPPNAILFGSQYLADLFKIFPSQPDAVAASYNGGEDNMKRWLARSRSNLPDLYVPEIVYAQSKDYVYKVMSSYRIYQAAYDENLRPR